MNGETFRVAIIADATRDNMCLIEEILVYAQHKFTTADGNPIIKLAHEVTLAFAYPAKSDKVFTTETWQPEYQI